jgi:predicted TIM-barrel fold metal-dependent hydrolase
MAQRRIISADSHMAEPGDLWTQRLDRKFRDRAPRAMKNDKDTGPAYVFVGPDILPYPVAGVFAAGKKGAELREHLKHGYENARPGALYPDDRIKDQDLDGIAAEVLYCSLALLSYNIKDVELSLACQSVYNRWLAEFCSHNPKRLYGIGLYSFAALPDLSEIERCARDGLKGILVMVSDNTEVPYSDSRFDPVWKICSEFGLPVSLHKPFTGTRPLTPVLPSPAAMQLNSIRIVEQALAVMVYGGVFERFPRLKLVSAENDVGWMPHWINRLDRVYKMLGDGLPLKPSEYVHRNVWATFQFDPVGPATLRFFGGERYMWASDFPHADSTFPHSREVVEELFAGVPEDAADKILFENANQLYQMQL